jgi:hypothetical protein
MVDRATNVDIASTRGRLVISDRLGIGVTELPLVASPPAPNCTTFEERAGVSVADADRNDSPADVDVASAAW